MTDPRLRVVPDDLDYGEGKTRQQDADDSAAMLGLLLLVVVCALLGIGLALLLW